MNRAAEQLADDQVLQNLPVALTSFVGRRAELVDICRLLTGTRLLTLTGAGGVGKSRLALEAARMLADDYPDGVHLIELGSLASPELVAHAVATVLGIVGQSGGSLLELVAEALRMRRLMLVLDNCEHLIGGCAEVVNHLLRACPGISVLTTSREPLGIMGECIWRVPSLSLPMDEQGPGSAMLEQSEAAQLFAERAALVLPGFAITGANALAVTRVCLRLDGIPLALELAAARVRVLSVEQLAERLDDALRILTQGSRTAPDRHHTPRATLDWSYSLLTRDEQRLFHRLAVFAGGWTVDAAEAVCSGYGVNPEQVLELLARLVDKSLLIADERGRHRFLEPIRQYAAERFAKDTAGPALRHAHATYVLERAERIEPELFGPAQGAWFDQLELDLGNARAVLDWSVADASRTEIGLRLASALFQFWDCRGHLREGNERLAVLLAQAESAVSDQVRAKAMYTRGNFLYLLGETDAAARLLEESVGLRRKVRDPAGLAWALWSLGMNARYRDAAIAFAAAEESLARIRELGGVRPGLPQVQWLLASLARSRGDYSRADTLFRESLAASRTLGDQWAVAMALRGLGGVRYLKGEPARAATLLGEALVIFRDIGNLRMVADSLEGLAAARAAAGEAECALRLAGAAMTIRERIGAPLSAQQGAVQERRLTPARQRLSAPAAEAAWQNGRQLTVQSAIAHALEDSSGNAGYAEPTLRAPQLTAREREVATLVLQGLSNHRIADALVIGDATAHRHIANILDKLGLHSRAEIAVWAMEHGLRPHAVGSTG
jgi:predicted ATPase/DNA-binding NarL/FixJ family response regulator